MPYAEPAKSLPAALPEPPFVIRVEHADVGREGTFRPQAHVAFGAALRSGGLLRALPAEAVGDLLLMLSFVTPNGNVSPTLRQLAEAMGVPAVKARRRLERLEAARFRGEPLLLRSRTGSGLEYFAPLPWLAPAREDAKPEPLHSTPIPIRAASREAVIAHTRATYARTRAEVEREIEEMMGHGRRPNPPKPEPRAEAAPLSPEEAASRREREEVMTQLVGAGLEPEQAASLLQGYDVERVRRQLAWLPWRRAKNPAGMLLAAVKGDYEAPLAARRQEAGAAPEEGHAPEASPSAMS